MDKKKIPVLSIALYAIAGMLVLYTIWSVSHSASYISELIAMGQLTVKGNEYDIVNFYMSNSAQFALFAVIIFALGWMLQKNSSRRLISLHTESEEGSSGKESANRDNEDDFDDWFQNSAK